MTRLPSGGWRRSENTILEGLQSGVSLWISGNFAIKAFAAVYNANFHAGIRKAIPYNNLTILDRFVLCFQSLRWAPRVSHATGNNAYGFRSRSPLHTSKP